MHRLGSANCTSIDRISRKCASLAYPVLESSQHKYVTDNPDALVTLVSRQIFETLPSHASKQQSSCQQSILTLSCSLVYPTCQTDQENQGLPHFSELLLNISSSCNVHRSELAGRLLHMGCLDSHVVARADMRDAIADGLGLACFLLVAWFCGWSLVEWFNAVCKDMVDSARQAAGTKNVSINAADGCNEQTLADPAYCKEKDLIEIV
ncbi:hypothetical protein J3B02_004882 [Coemansia erecta]|uniref:Uncharacterized protein n=1 Tax=Coemansia asiatica TaxID=1052880 RepID=A0A9W7XGH8_9FUNG|nr:hypothetical protein LPJ64_005813 [Coemansia asiatica]KAJ2844736.1 hypothetical protein J3B02_004882 [Coemansia erecta]